MTRIYLDQKQNTQPKKRVYLDQQQSAKKQRVYIGKKAPQRQPKKTVWNRTMNNLIKSAASASNAFEDTGKFVAGVGVSPFTKNNLSQNLKKVGFAPLKHQRDVFAGRNQRTYSDFMNEIAAKEKNPLLRTMQRTIGYGGDILLDPLNKLKIASLTAKGIKASKTGKVALSSAEKARKGQSALLQYGNKSLLPKAADEVIGKGFTKLNDAIRGTKGIKHALTVGSKISSKVRPLGVGREEFKVLRDAKTAARNLQGYSTDKSIDFARNLSKQIGKASPENKSLILEAVELGDKSLAPKGMGKVFDEALSFSKNNSEEWKRLGGSVLEGHGLSHVANKATAEASRKKALSGQGIKLISTQTPQDAHRQWAKVGGKNTHITKDLGNAFPFGKAPDGSALTALLKDGGRSSAQHVFNNPRNPKAIELYNKLNGINSNPNNIANKVVNLTKKDFVNATLDTKIFNKINKVGDFNIAKVGFHTGREWKILPKDVTDFKVVSERSYKPIAEFHTREELWKYLKDNPSIQKTKPLQRDLGKIVNLEEQGIKWLDDIYEKGKGGFANRAGEIVDVQQATGPAINRGLLEQGGKEIFEESLPLAVAKMGISTGKKRAGVEFLEATKGLQGDEAKKIANEAYEKITNIESVQWALKKFDSIQNIWKAQALLGPSYHVRNVAGNLWNNNLAGVNVASYATAGELQYSMKFGKATGKQKKLYDEMARNGVIGTGQFTKDIAQEIESKIGKATVNPLSQKFGGYRLNRWLGGGIEDNAKIAHYMSKRADGFGAKEAAESVKKYLFDYGDLTFTEQNLLKRVMPFYTWTSKNLPLQVQNFIQKPGKYAKIATAKKNIEQNVKQPNERYMSDYIASNGPIRYKTDEQGNTKYFLIGQWLPAAAAWQVLSRPDEAVIGQTSPLLKLPYETLANQGTFFKNTTGQYDKLTKYPGEKRSYLGMDLDPRTVNALRSIRPLNEINKLNPAEVFGAKNKPSMLRNLGIDIASNQRGGRYTPESTQLDRLGESFIGKSQNYQAGQAKYFYDRDTANMMTEFKNSINKASDNQQFELAEKLIEKRNAFIRERNGQTELDQAVEKTNPFY